MYKRLAPVAVAAISNGITIGDANPPVPTSATIVKKLDPPMSEIPSNISTMDPTIDITFPANLPAW